MQDRRLGKNCEACSLNSALSDEVIDSDDDDRHRLEYFSYGASSAESPDACSTPDVEHIDILAVEMHFYRKCRAGHCLRVIEAG